MMKLALFSGLRKSEMLKLRWVDVDYRNGFIYLPDSKSGKDERIPMSNPAREVLDAMPGLSPEFLMAVNEVFKASSVAMPPLELANMQVVNSAANQTAGCDLDIAGEICFS